MTDSQQLFAEYRRNGSDTAFRELVNRYVDLVYSTARRLVEGDTHRAEDVAQTVFVDLARKAGARPEDLRRDANGPLRSLLNTRLSRVELLKERLRQTPEANIPELKSLTEDDWLNAVKEDLKTEADFRKALSKLRYSAESKYASKIQDAVEKFSQANGGEMPANLSQLKPYFKPPIEDAILNRYEIVPADSLPMLTLPGSGWVVTQKAPVDLEYDSKLVMTKMDGGFGYGGSGSFAESEMVKSLTPAIKAYFTANSQGTLTDPAQLAPYATTPDAQAALAKAIKYFADESPKSRTESLKRLERLRPK